MLNVVMLRVMASEHPLQRASTSGGHNTALLAYLLCFVLAISACSSKLIFVAAADITNKIKQSSWYMPLISLFLI